MSTLEEKLGELVAEQSKLLKAIEADRKKGRDLWERLGMLSGVVSAILVAFIGYLTIQENRARAIDDGVRKQAEIDMLQMQTIEKFIPHLASVNEEEKKVTVLALSLLKNDKFVAQLTTLYPTAGVKQAGEIIMARGDTITVAAPSSQPEPGTGWAYLGTYNSATGLWETRYFDFPVDASPDSLKDKDLSVRIETGAINIRTGLPNAEGLLPRVKSVLPEKAVAHVEDVKAWGRAGYHFALVRNPKIR